ncbi:MAG TPA: adenosine kinase [Patescibacteria group bacterium]|nr:adenosine kinase [Patescibacteria group bacterium]
MPEKKKAGDTKNFGLVAIGNALVDVLARVDDNFLQARAMLKGGMALIDTAAAQALAAAVQAEKEMSGGSAANSLAGFVSYGGNGAFLGKVAGDRFGGVFRADMDSQGVHFPTAPHTGAEETGRSYIMVTPDGERTMNTYLGANAAFGPDDVDEDVIADAKIILVEGYLFDQPGTKAAFIKAANAAHAAGTKVAFTLSDHKCVGRHHAEFADLVENHVDILFGNEKELKALTLKEDFDDAARDIGSKCAVAIITRGSKGAVIVADGVQHVIAPVKPRALVDTTGAGDAFAAGVLYGLAEGRSYDEAGHLGAMAASHTISHTGARDPAVKFSSFLRQP